MQSSRSAVFAREDTMFGVCEAVGQDFGFNPLYLRIAFAAPVLFNPLAAFGAYAALGALVLISRLLVPSRPRTWTLRSAAAGVRALFRRSAPAPVIDAAPAAKVAAEPTPAVAATVPETVVAETAEPERVAIAA